MNIRFISHITTFGKAGALLFCTIFFFGCTSTPVRERLYEGEPLSAEQVSIISNGLTESEPHIGGFFPVKIDNSNKCHLYRESACEILPGKHTLQTNYVWFTSEASAVLAAIDRVCDIVEGHKHA